MSHATSALELSERTPVIVSSGQSIARDPAAASYPGPADMAAEAAKAALQDASVSADQVDAVAAVRLFADSSSLFGCAFGQSSNYPRSVANRIGANPKLAIYGPTGGQSPQVLLMELCQRIAAGEMQTALLFGSEAIASERSAKKAGVELDWNESPEGDFDNRVTDESALARPWEMAHGVGLPVWTYPLFEHAQRHKAGRSREELQRQMARLFSKFSQVAANNPYSQFPQAYTEDELLAMNQPQAYISDPYSKHLVARDSVNQGAAILVMSVAAAKAAGVPESQWVHVQGFGHCEDHMVSERADLASNEAAAVAAKAAFEMAACGMDDIAFMDLYSCFPVAVSGAMEALGIDESDPRGLTLTGGLPYFGGAGNNYSMHGMAEAIQRLRSAEKHERALVYANGGYLSKHSFAVYGREPSTLNWADADNSVPLMPAETSVEVNVEPSGEGVIESFSIVYAGGQPAQAIILGRCSDQRRFVAVNADGDQATAAALAEGEPIGRKVELRHQDGRNFFELID